METQKLYGSELEKAFEQELLDKGYPASRIVNEFGKIPYGIVDFAIMDIDCKTPIAFYEVKSKLGVRNFIAHKGFNSLISSFQKLCKFYGMIVPCFLVYKETQEEKFSVVDLTKFVGGEKLPDSSIAHKILFEEASELPAYRYNNSGEIKKAIRRAETKQKRIDQIKPICWGIFPLIAIALLILDALEIYTFTAMRLIVIGVTVLLILLPFFSEISIKDISLKRKDRKDKGNNEDN